MKHRRPHSNPRVLLAGPLAALLLASAACMIGETTHSLALEPSGAVSWLAVEREVRSDRDEPSERESEEAAYLEAARGGAQPVADALRALGADRLRVDLLRQRRPFAVATQADFARVDYLARALLAGLGWDGEVVLERLGTLRRLTIAFDPDEDTDHGDDRLLALIEPAAAYRLVLTEGRFAEAVGFDLEHDCTQAALDPDAFDPGDDGRVTLVLAWHDHRSR